MPEDHLSTGKQALTRGAWQQARLAFTAALQQQETAEAYDGLGMAAWWLNDAAVTFEARQRAYQLYSARGDVRNAARVAAWLALDHFYFRGEYAIANGWIQRGRRLVETVEPGAELGWLDLAQAHVIIWAELDYVTAQRLCRQVVTLAKTLGDVDLEMAGQAGEGLCLVNQGSVGEGMRRLDQATLAVVAGDMTDIDAACTACCSLIFACEWTRDYERAAQWIEHLRDLATQWSHPTLLAFCQVHYASLLIWRGEWAAAEVELLAATGELEITQQPSRVAEGLVRLAELRCRQGRFTEAAALFTQVESPAFKSLAGDFSLYGRAALALAQNELETAANLAERFLRALPGDNRLDRVAGLELLIQAQARRGRRQQVEQALTEMKTAVANVTTRPMQAAVAFAEGLALTLAENLDGARRCFEDAVELWQRAGIPFEAARARLELARSLLALDQNQAAHRQAAKAAQALEQLGAQLEHGRATTLLQQIDSLSPEQTGRSTSPANLTPRELEVLQLLATGRSNQEISRQLVLSVRTVERHISNIYNKLGATGPAARAAATAFAAQHNLL